MIFIERIKARTRAIYYRIVKRKSSTISMNSYIGNNVVLEGKNSIGLETKLENVSMGYGSYIANQSELSQCRIGRYCSIGSHVRLIIGKHPSKGFVSTHPAFFSVDHLCKLCYVKSQKFDEFAYIDAEKNNVAIGNDVWIGDGVSILGGIQIGDGAIVAAGAVVVKDVEPYTIVGGVPAKTIRKRFTEEQIRQLEKIQWWNHDEAWLREKADLFEDVEVFLKNAESMI